MKSKESSLATEGWDKSLQEMALRKHTNFLSECTMQTTLALKRVACWLFGHLAEVRYPFVESRSRRQWYSIKTLYDAVFCFLESAFRFHLANWNSWRLLSSLFLKQSCVGAGCILDQFETWFSGHSIHLCTTQALCFWWSYFRWRVKRLNYW